MKTFIRRKNQKSHFLGSILVGLAILVAWLYGYGTNWEFFRQFEYTSVLIGVVVCMLVLALVDFKAFKSIVVAIIIATIAILCIWMFDDPCKNLHKYEGSAQYDIYLEKCKEKENNK